MTSRTNGTELENPLDGHIGYQVHRAAAATQDAFAIALAQLGLRPLSAIVLHLVNANPGCNQSAIGRALGVQRTNLVPVMSDLEKRALILRTRADGRSNALHISDEGLAMIAGIERISREIEERCFGHVSPRLRARMLHSLREARRIVE